MYRISTKKNDVNPLFRFGKQKYKKKRTYILPRLAWQYFKLWHQRRLTETDLASWALVFLHNPVQFSSSCSAELKLDGNTIFSVSLFPVMDTYTKQKGIFKRNIKKQLSYNYRDSLLENGTQGGS